MLDEQYMLLEIELIWKLNGRKWQMNFTIKTINEKFRRIDSFWHNCSCSSLLLGWKYSTFANSLLVTVQPLFTFLERIVTCKCGCALAWNRLFSNFLFLLLYQNFRIHYRQKWLQCFIFITDKFKLLNNLRCQIVTFYLKNNYGRLDF